MKLTYVHNQPINPVIKRRAEVLFVKDKENKRLQSCDATEFKENYIKPVNFKSRYIKPTPMLKSTYNEVKSFYQDYQKSLGNIPFKDIVQMAKNISKDTGYSKKEVLTVMQKLTQFANMRGINKIVEVMNKHQICYIGNSNYSLEISKNKYMPINSKEIYDVVHDKVGLHRTLTYLIDNKHFGTLERVGELKTAYFLDEQKVSQLEKLKKADPDKFNKFKNLKEIKFFTISGWDSGISFIDRTKNLEEETRRVIKYAEEHNLPLDKAVDDPLRKRINALGISPVVISKEGMPTEQCVYNQVSPETMTEMELFNLIDANADIRAKDIVSLLKIKDNSIKYLKNNFAIFTPETISASIKNIHQKVLQNAENRGFNPDKILFVEPEPVKSNALLTYMYKKINNIPDEQFANVAEIMNKRVNPAGRLVVFIDDCTITGESLKGAISTSRDVFKKNQDKLFVCLCGTRDAVENFSNKDNSNLIVEKIINHEPTYKKRLVSIKLNQTVGEPDFGEGEATCLILPYMSPDTNTEFASNVALLHNTTYRTSNPLTTRYCRDSHKYKYKKGAFVSMSTLKHEGIKNYTSTVDLIGKITHRLAGSSPVTTEESFNSIKKANPRNWKDYLKLSTYEEMIEEYLNPNLL